MSSGSAHSLWERHRFQGDCLPPRNPCGVMANRLPHADFDEKGLRLMNLRFARHGLQFFFITLCVSGRRKMLSRIVDEKSRPSLTPLGECIAALWRHLHTLNPALTASNSVIMPDHVHLLLIVNFDRDPTFRPLVFIHWFMEETERMMAATDGGGSPRPSQSGIAPSGWIFHSLRGNSKPFAAIFGSIRPERFGKCAIPIASCAMPASAIPYWRRIAHGMPSAISRSSARRSFSRCASPERNRWRNMRRQLMK